MLIYFVMEKSKMIIWSIVCFVAGLVCFVLSEQTTVDVIILCSFWAISSRLLICSDPDNRKKLRWKKEYFLIEILFIAAVVFAVIAWLILNDKQVSISIVILILLLGILAAVLGSDKVKSEQ